MLLLSAGLLAGFIDSIAGGGGLVTLPVLSFLIMPGPHAIGTNKIVGTAGSLAAFLVYLRAGHMDWPRSLAFGLWVAVGSFCGSRASPLVPVEAFRWILLGACPVILYVVFHKDLWTSERLQARRKFPEGVELLFWPRLVAAGFAAGFYDGFLGPGGGTFMFLGLLFIVRMPLLAAIAGTKLVNTFSASTALATYGLGGYVHVLPGCVMASGVMVGSTLGARYANKRAAAIVRPVLGVVALLLMTKLAFKL